MREHRGGAGQDETIKHTKRDGQPWEFTSEYVGAPDMRFAIIPPVR